MKRNLILIAMLAGCAVSPPERPVADRAPAEPEDGLGQRTAKPTRTYKPGIGIVQSASVVALSSADSASAGGTARPATTPTMAYRLKMPDGTTQDVVQAGERFRVGDRVQVTSDGRLVRP
jgi:hypothetical protein